MTINSAKPSKIPTHDGTLPPVHGVDQGPGVIVARARECPADHVIDWHTHARGQLLFAASGIMQVTTAAGVWVVPPQRAVWIPPGIEHHVRAQGTPMALRSLYVREDALVHLPGACCVVTVSPLLRELILEAMTLPDDPSEDSAAGRLVGVILDRIEASPVAPLHLPTPGDPRLVRIADALIEDPADTRTLIEWADHIGASERTLARAFQRETGMTFGAWRQQVRLLAALTQLGRGDSVTAVALDLGYNSQSAFIAMFRRALGRTPARYFSD